MSVCTFFGHHDCPAYVKPKLRAVIIDLIENCGVDCFYVGNHGAFDVMARSVLRELTKIYPHISYCVVLAYMPQKGGKSDIYDYSETLLPEEIENVPKRFAIDRRNRWMVAQADYAVTYITHSWGGAAKYAKLAKNKNKTEINLGQI